MAPAQLGRQSRIGRRQQTLALASGVRHQAQFALFRSAELFYNRHKQHPGLDIAHSG
ncbi:MAG: hypothetical protein K2X71_25945 [Methylobacterium sp.]|uniref:hypothetical protein n=1 Tax=Methylobacterium sp. TaxID=409 RepID=UPI00258CCA73|nr:hypothetical protein [Methylobacterium sp.]MBY0299436.1 hypothetical protein [Methylobacterium sp.]